MEASNKLSKDKHVMSVGKADKAKDKLLSNSKRKTKANANIVEGKTSHSLEEYESSTLPPVSSLLSKHGRSDNIRAKDKKDSIVTLPIDPEQHRPTPIRPRKSCEGYLASDILQGEKTSLNSTKTQRHTGEQNKFEIDKQRIYGSVIIGRGTKIRNCFGKFVWYDWYDIAYNLLRFLWYSFL